MDDTASCPSTDCVPEQSFEVEDARARGELRAGLGGRAASSFAWRGVAIGTSVLVRFGVLAVLGRLLTPSAFGIVAMSGVVLAAIGSLADLGLGNAVIQRPKITGSQLGWVSRLNLSAALILCAACVLASRWVGRFFHEPAVGPVLALSAASLPIAATAFVPRALLTRHLQFRELTVCDLAGAIASGAVSIALAVGGLGVWSLVAGNLAGAVVIAGVLRMVSPGSPAASGPVTARRALLQFGLVVAAMGVLNSWAYSVDNLMVGRLLGAAALGVYAITFNLALLPASQFSGLASAVLFPAFSAIQDERGRLAAAYLRSLRWSATLVFPCCAIMGALAPQVIQVFLGSKWLSGVIPLRLLLLMAAMRSLYTFAGSVLRSVGQPHIELIFQAVLSLGVGVSAAVGSRAGINGVAAAVTGFVCCIAGPLFITVTAKAAHTSLAKALGSATVPALAAICGGTVSLLAARLALNLWGHAPSAVILTLSVPPGAFIYGLVVALMAPDLVADGRTRLLGMLNSRASMSQVTVVGE